jgi:xanthine dehydrogenase YagR molybdenum-binding subunit
MNADVADFHVPVNADIGEIDVAAIDIPDPKLDSLGARGIGGNWDHRDRRGHC